MPFTLLDVEASAPGGWASAFVSQPAGLATLLDGYAAQARARAAARLGCAGPAALAGLRAILDLLHRWHGRTHGTELDLLAAAAGRGRAELLLANLAYDLGTLGCSTFLRDGRSGPLHARNLDWPFPGALLRRHGCVLRVHGAPAGGYAVVGWPGLVGALTAVAPGRFTVSVNFVRHRHDGLARLLARAALGALPVPWAVRDALDHARTFSEATERLRRAPLLAPVLLALAGPRRGEAVVVERTAGGAELRLATAGRPLPLEPLPGASPGRREHRLRRGRLVGAARRSSSAGSRAPPRQTRAQRCACWRRRCAPRRSSRW